MKEAIRFLILGFFISLNNNILQAQAPKIGGEISWSQNLDLGKSGDIWEMTKFRLKLDHKVGNSIHAYVNLKMYTTGAARFDWKLSEAYIDSYLGKFDIRAGMQVISWGTAWMINPTNNINPYDLSEQEAFIPEERLGVPALRINYYPIPKLTLTGILIPYFIPAVEEPGAELPENKLKNSEYALKLTAQSIMGCDLSVSYFKGKEDYPWINGQYRDAEIYGGDIIGSIAGVNLWVEGAYSKPELGDSYYQIAAGGEYTFGDDLYLMGQFYHRSYEDKQENYMMAVLRHPIGDIHAWQLGLAYETENRIFIIYPELTISLADAASLVLAAIIVQGEVAGTFLSRMKNRIFLKLKYSF